MDVSNLINAIAVTAGVIFSRPRKSAIAEP
jgi:hypothetical protein